MNKLTKKLLDSLDEIVTFTYTLRYSNKYFYYQVDAIIELFNKIDSDKSGELEVIIDTLRDYKFECVSSPLLPNYKKFKIKVKSLTEFYNIYNTDNYIKNTPQSIKRKIEHQRLKEWEKSSKFIQSPTKLLEKKSTSLKNSNFLKELTLVKYDYDSFPKEWKEKNENTHKDKIFIYIGEVNKMKHHVYVQCLKSGKPYIFDIHNLKELAEEEL